MTRVIISLAGSKFSGKTTAFYTIKSEFKNVTELTLAGHLKEVCAQVFEIDPKYFHDPKLKEVELPDPVDLDIRQVDNIIRLFGYEPDFDTHIRSHIGKILFTPRQVLQYIGTDVLHKINSLIHVEHATKNMPKDGLVVVTDLRFTIEMQYFLDNFSSEFTPMYIKNSRAEAVASKDMHPSEQQLHEFKHKCLKIDNDFSISEFKIKVVEEVKKLYGAQDE